MAVGNYRIIKEIGVDANGEPTGGFGRIFQAEHLLLKEKACLKQNKSPDKTLIDLLRQEAKILWKLDEHHSIPAAKDFFMAAKDVYVLAMSYIEGETLGQAVKQHGRLHPEDACWITERLLGALYYAHCNGVVHSDVKPENVFVEPKKRDIKLIDFGLSIYKPTAATRPIGRTPLYAAPELDQDKPPIPETDLYGAGLVLLYALGGDIQTKTFPKDTPKQIAEFGSRLLRYDPTQRPNWDKESVIETLSDIRYEVFGRRHVR